VFDFTFENPRDGRFKDHPDVKRMLEEFSHSVKLVDTSYCHYGSPFRKSTIFVTSLMNLQAQPPCPSNPCESRKEFRNSIPGGLIDCVIDAWVGLHVVKMRAYIIIDVFSGWGSVEKRVRVRQAAGSLPLSVKVYSNDIVKGRGANFDMDMSVWNPGVLLLMALVQCFGFDADSIVEHAGGPEGWAQQNNVAVLFHMSTPCETYSVNGICKHREKGSCTPKSDEAVKADKMNEQLVKYVRRVVLGERVSPPTP